MPALSHELKGPMGFTLSGNGAATIVTPIPMAVGLLLPIPGWEILLK